PRALRRPLDASLSAPPSRGARSVLLRLLPEAPVPLRGQRLEALAHPRLLGGPERDRLAVHRLLAADERAVLAERERGEHLVARGQAVLADVARAHVQRLVVHEPAVAHVVAVARRAARLAVVDPLVDQEQLAALEKGCHLRLARGRAQRAVEAIERGALAIDDRRVLAAVLEALEHDHGAR